MSSVWTAETSGSRFANGLRATSGGCCVRASTNSDDAKPWRFRMVFCERPAATRPAVQVVTSSSSSSASARGARELKCRSRSRR
jgi:hypothetical protein